DSWFRYNTSSSTRKVITHTFVSDSRRVRNYTVLFDGDKHAPIWAAFPMHAGVYGGTTERSNSWQDDPAIPFTGWQQPGLDNATAVGYSRGHFVASQYRKKNDNANLQTFYRTNQAPQWQNGFNSGVWSSLEQAVFDASPTTSSDTLYVVVGVLYEGTVETLPSGSIQVPLPSHFYTCVMKCSFNSSGAMTGASGKAFIYTNENHPSVSTMPYNHADYVTTIDAIESRAGFDFFKNVPDQYEASAENGTSALNL
ncbi:MAG: DNA/RNA non-specific endonuclease, partial [Bacteroidales bacterium]|nr:DNA/RNA non-specific endonuclease [Bacteroidales bacterium]